MKEINYGFLSSDSKRKTKRYVWELMAVFWSCDLCRRRIFSNRKKRICLKIFIRMTKGKCLICPDSSGAPSPVTVYSLGPSLNINGECEFDRNLSLLHSSDALLTFWTETTNWGGHGLILLQFTYRILLLNNKPCILPYLSCPTHNVARSPMSQSARW